MIKLPELNMRFFYAVGAGAFSIQTLYSIYSYFLFGYQGIPHLVYAWIFVLFYSLLAYMFIQTFVNSNKKQEAVTEAEVAGILDSLRKG